MKEDEDEEIEEEESGKRKEKTLCPWMRWYLFSRIFVTGWSRIGISRSIIPTCFNMLVRCKAILSHALMSLLTTAGGSTTAVADCHSAIVSQLDETLHRKTTSHVICAVDVLRSSLVF